MKRMALTVLLLLGVAVCPMAQTIGLDLVPSDADIDATLSVAKGSEFTAYLRVNGAVDMTGVSADLMFDATNIELLSIQEVPGDLNFDGQLDSGKEVIPVINQLIKEDNFIADFGDFRDGWGEDGRNSGVVYDTNNNQATDGDEVIDIINELIRVDNFAETQFWTRDVFTQTPDSYNESVEIFDPVDKSNTGGDHPGLIDDMTSVLLARPDRDKDTNFGFTGDGIIAILKFKVKSTADNGTCDFTFPEAVWIDKDFASLSDVKDIPTTTTSTVTVTD